MSACTRASERRRKSSPRMMIDTVLLPALKAISSRSASASSTSTGKPNRLPNGGTAPGTQPVSARSSCVRREAQGAGAEHRAQPGIVDAARAGQHDVDGPIRRQEDEGLRAGLDRGAAHARRLLAGEDRRVLHDPKPRVPLSQEALEALRDGSPGGSRRVGRIRSHGVPREDSMRGSGRRGRLPGTVSINGH